MKKKSIWGEGREADIWGSWFDIINKREERNKKRKAIKEEINKRAKENYSSIKVGFNDKSESSFTKQRKFYIKLDERGVDNISVDEVFNVYDRTPDKTDFIDDQILSERLLGPNKPLEKLCGLALCKTNYQTVLDDTKRFFSGDITYNQLRENFDEAKVRAYIKRIKPGGTDINENNSGDKKDFSWNDINKEAEKKFINLINQKVTIKSYTQPFESLSRGKRINKSYIQGTSYKPLVYKETSIGSKKNLLIIIDGSGSMGCKSNLGEDAIYQAHSFSSALFHCGKFNVKKTIHHDSGGWFDVNRFYEKGELKVATGGGEGFDRIDDNLDDDFLKDVDYIVVLTDLRIGRFEQDGLYEYIKKRKHMVISFANSGELKGMPVRVIKTKKDMVNAIVTLVG